MPFSTNTTGIDGLVVVEPQVFGDERGFFLEVYQDEAFEALGLPKQFVQLNHSGSGRGVVRGLHFQPDPPMGKLMRVTRGEAMLVGVDIRKGSPTLGQWHAITANEDNRLQLWGEAGFARGFCALSEFVEVQYLCTGRYNPQSESGVLWNDPEIGIDWPISDPILSDKDRDAQSLAQWLERPESNAFVYEDAVG